MNASALVTLSSAMQSHIDQIIDSAGTLEDDRHLCFGGAGLAGSLRPPLTLDLLSIPGCGRAAA